MLHTSQGSSGVQGKKIAAATHVCTMESSCSSVEMLRRPLSLLSNVSSSITLRSTEALLLRALLLRK